MNTNTKYSTTATFLGARGWGCQVFNNGNLVAEGSCYSREDIGGVFQRLLKNLVDGTRIYTFYDVVHSLFVDAGSPVAIVTHLSRLCEIRPRLSDAGVKQLVNELNDKLGNSAIRDYDGASVPMHLVKGDDRLGEPYVITVTTGKNIVITNIAAAVDIDVGVDVDAADDIVFAQTKWQNGDLEQAEQRIADRQA